MLKAVAQEHSMGCGIACIACVAGIKYSKALKFVQAKYASTKGYYCRDVVKALRKIGLSYEYKKFTPKTKKYLEKEGTIVFIKRSSKYPKGHYLVKTNSRWMNSWINYPDEPAKVGLNKKIPGKAQWIIFNRNLV